MRTYRRSRTDANHAPIGQALRDVTFVRDVHGDGNTGCDYVARHLVDKLPVFIEVKRPDLPPYKRALTESEQEMRDAFPGRYAVVMTEDEALAAVGAIR